MNPDEQVIFYRKQLNLLPHPEGGFFSEVFRSPGVMPASYMDSRLTGTRNFSTSIYYLLGPGNKSCFHKIKQEEIWHFYAGSCALEIVVLQNGEAQHFYLGSRIENGEQFQLVVAANCWFAAKPLDENGFVLSGCTVSPGFDFEDFEIANTADLLEMYPTQKTIIELFNR